MADRSQLAGSRENHADQSTSRLTHHGQDSSGAGHRGSLGEHVVGQYVLLKIEDESGRVGLGEASVTSVWSGETQAGTIALIHEVFSPLVAGADPYDGEWIMHRLERAAFGNSFAKAAVEMALLDLQGQILGVPLFKLLGGCERAGVNAPGIRLKFVIGAVEPALAAERAHKMVQRGWNAIKVKIGRQGDPKIDVERLRAVREAVGPEIWLSVDANGGYSVAQAIWTHASWRRATWSCSNSRHGAATTGQWPWFVGAAAFRSWPTKASLRHRMRWISFVARLRTS